MKKAEALLIVILFIAIFGAVAVVVTRDGLLNGIFTNNTVDAMSAEEASQSGLEAGLLYYKNNPSVAGTSNTILCVNVDEASVAKNPIAGCSGMSTTRYAEVTITPPSGVIFVTIQSVGHYGYVVKQHKLTYQVARW